MNIEFIKEKILSGNYRITKHATIQRVKRNISVDEIEEAVMDGEVIEEYPEDKYAPSVLILGFTKKKRPLHVLCSYTNIPWIITSYQPDPKQWVDFKTRKISNE